MTKATPLGLALSGTTARRVVASRAVTVGRYTYTPAAAYSSPDACSTLHGDGARVELRVTESLFGDFLKALDVVQEELSQRWNDQARSGHCATLA